MCTLCAQCIACAIAASPTVLHLTPREICSRSWQIPEHSAPRRTVDGGSAFSSAFLFPLFVHSLATGHCRSTPPLPCRVSPPRFLQVLFSRIFGMGIDDPYDPYAFSRLGLGPIFALFSSPAKIPRSHRGYRGHRGKSKQSARFDTPMTWPMTPRCRVIGRGHRGGIGLRALLLGPLQGVGGCRPLPAL